MHRRSLYIMHLALYPCLSSPTDFSEEPKILEAGRRDDGKQGQRNDTVGSMPHGFFAIPTNQAAGIGGLAES
jgi:hypothetical protein